MSVYIKGMEMPKTGRYFVSVDNTDGKDKTVISVMSEFEREDKTRPLLSIHEVVPVPPHGRLIDADAPIKVWEVKLSDGDSCSFRNIETTVSKFLLSHLMGEVPPTIIPAEEGE